ncbi:MAG: AsmA family protein [Burkholderiaceae bacterium]
MQARPRKILLISGASVLGLLALVLIVVSTLDWNRAKPWINDKVSQATQRSFAINGDLALDWERPLHVQSGWRKWIPWPHLRAHDVQLGNVDWAKTGPDMARVQRVDFTINPFALLARRISVDSLLLTEPNLNFEQNKEGENNWTFPKKEEKESGSKWTFDLQDLAIAKGDIRYVDPGKQADVQLRIDTEDDGTVTWKLGGLFNDEKLSGEGKAGSLLMLQNPGTRYPAEALVKVGETTITAKGSVTDPSHPSALDVELKILGASMADLFPLSGVLLPETPKFSTAGRVVGTLARDAMRLRYEKFTGKVGSSDIGGTLEYRQQKPRPLLSGEVVSDQLVFKDLGAIVGSSDKKPKEGEVKQPPDKVLPVSPFKTERWDKMDVQVRFRGKKIIHSDKLPIDNLNTTVKMDNGVLTLDPLDFGVAGGKLATRLTIDGKNKPAKARLNMSARGVKLAELFPKAESMQASIGQVNGDAQLTAAGNSFAELLGSSNGEVKSLISQGSVSKFILEAAGLNVGSAVIAKLFGDRQVPLNCMAADFNVTDGLMETRTFVVDTQDALIRVSGDINFDSEELDLTIHPDSKGVRILSLRSPLYVQGTFKNPDVGVDKGVIALKGGAAVALGVAAAPFAALLALINPGPGQDSPCGILLAEAKEKPKAPPPGKTKTPEP